MKKKTVRKKTDFLLEKKYVTAERFYLFFDCVCVSVLA